jgi:hypothetical protein
MLVHRQPGDEHREVKINACQRGEAECNPEQVELFHGGNMWPRASLSRGFERARSVVRFAFARQR